MCVIDEAIAFMGGLDLCFGRWDTPQHILVDDGNVEGAEGSTQIWPGMLKGCTKPWHLVKQLFQARIIATPA